MRKLQLTEKFKARKAEEKVENGLQIFNFENAKIRTTTINEDIWFSGKDVCLYFDDSNHNRSISRLSDEDKISVDISTNAGIRSAIFINETGLYDLLFSMRPQKANNGGVQDAYPKEVQERINKLKRFKRWVTHEVIPSIRKTGSYSTQNLSPAELFLQNAQLFVEQERKLKAIENKVEAITDKIEVVSIRPEKDWRNQTTECLNEIAKKRGGEYREVRTESYDLLDERMHVDVHARLKNKKKRMAELGISKSSQNKVTILDVIEDDPKLIEGYISVVKDMYLSH